MIAVRLCFCFKGLGEMGGGGRELRVTVGGGVEGAGHSFDRACADADSE